MFSIENEFIQAGIQAKGAELTRLYVKPTQLDYLWNGDPAFWAKHSPILFPIVGTLKADTYYFDSKPYKLSRHGFARDMTFTLSEQRGDSLTLALESSDETLARYPFPFRLELSYSLIANSMLVEYRVINTGEREMYFSIGAHPAFKVPLEPGSTFQDYYIEFAEKESAGRWPISPQGLIEALPLELLNDTRMLPLSHELFNGDALVCKHLRSSSLSLRSHRSEHGVKMLFEGFPYLGIWSGNNGNFVCIEPWCGIADGVASNQQLAKKEGINMITPGQVFTRQWTAEFF